MKTKLVIIGLIGIIVALVGILFFQNYGAGPDIQTYEPDKYFCYHEVESQKGYWNDNQESEDACLNDCASYCTKLGYKYENSEIVFGDVGKVCDDNEIFYTCSCFCN